MRRSWQGTWKAAAAALPCGQCALRAAGRFWPLSRPRKACSRLVRVIYSLPCVCAESVIGLSPAGSPRTSVSGRARLNTRCQRNGLQTHSAEREVVHGTPQSGGQPARSGSPFPPAHAAGSLRVPSRSNRGRRAVDRPPPSPRHLRKNAVLPLLPRICAVKLDAGNLLQIHGGHPRASHGKVTEDES